MRLIDADAFKLELQGHFETVEQDVTMSSDFQSGAIMGLEAAEFAIRCTPSIDAAPVVHGRWEHRFGDEWCCTMCGYVVHTDGSWEHPFTLGKKYCENCGAKMNGVENNAE